MGFTNRGVLTSRGRGGLCRQVRAHVWETPQLGLVFKWKSFNSAICEDAYGSS